MSLMDHNMSDEMLEFDLNQQPLDFFLDDPNPMQGLEPSREAEAAHGPIMERIRRLEAVGSRILERQGERQDQTLQIQNPPVEERTLDTGKMGKARSSRLIAQALGMDSSAGRGGFYDCNICLKMAREPILTCCGHLFCWPCFYFLPCLQSNLRECPVCEGIVADMSITPIYGNHDDSREEKILDNCTKIPPRPRAHRIESTRQQQRLRRSNGVPVHGGLHHHFTSIDGGLHHHFTSIISIMQNREYLNNAMNSADRLVQGMEAYITSPQVSQINDNNSSPSIAVPIQPENQTQNASGLRFRVPSESSNRRSNVASVANFLDETVDSSTDNDPTVPFTSLRGRP